MCTLISNIQLDYHAIAKMYGNGATFNSIEHRFRSYRKKAQDLIRDAESSGKMEPLSAAVKARLPRARTAQGSSVSSNRRKGAKNNENSDKHTSETPIFIDDSDKDAFEKLGVKLEEFETIKELISIKRNAVIEVDADKPLKFPKREGAIELEQVPHHDSQKNGYTFATTSSPASVSAGRFDFDKRNLDQWGINESRAESLDLDGIGTGWGFAEDEA